MRQVLRSFKCLYSIKWLFFNVSNIFQCNNVFSLFFKGKDMLMLMGMDLSMQNYKMQIADLCKTANLHCSFDSVTKCMTLHLLKLSWYSCLWKKCSLLPYSMERSVHPCEAPCKIHFKCYHIKGMSECPSSLLWLLFSFSVVFAGAE